MSGFGGRPVPHSYRVRRPEKLWPPPGWTWNGIEEHRDHHRQAMAILCLLGHGAASERARDWTERVPMQRAVGDG